MKKLELSNENNVIVCDRIEEFLTDAAVERKTMLRIKLAAEEVLLKYRDAFGAEGVFSYKFVKRMRRLQIEFRIPGERFDPFENENEDSDVLRSILAGMGVIPVWQYKNGENIIIFTAQKKKRSQLASLVLAVALAAGIGGLCFLLPQEARSFIKDDLVTPVFNVFVGLLSAVAGPITFLSVTWGIYGIGDMSTLGKIGKKMIGRFVVISFLITAVACVIFLPFFQMGSSGGGTFNFSEMFNMVLGIIPDNFFAPFIENNPLQIIFIAVIVGIAMLILGSRSSVVSSLVDQLNSIIQLIMSGLSSLIPVFVFCSLLNMILGNDLSALSISYKLLPLYIMGVVIVMAIYVVLVCSRKKVRPSVLIKKLMPAFLIGITTASSAAAYSTSIDTCEKKLGVDKRVVNIGLPLGQTMFMPAMCLLLLLASLCMAEVYGVSISPTWLAMAMIISTIMAIAAPPVPGGMISCFTILFLQLDIPSEGVAIMATLNVILDFIATAVDLFMLPAELVELSGDIDMLDIEKLKSE